MKNQLGNSRMDAILKMLLIVFISLLAFSSGVYFGKQLSDSDYKLQALSKDFNHEGEVAGAAAPEGRHEGNPEDAISEEEVNATYNKMVNAEKESSPEGSKEAMKTDGGPASNKEGEIAKGEKKEEKSVPTHVAESAEKPAKSEVKSKTAGFEAKPDLSAATKAANRVAKNAAPEEPVKKVESRVPSSLPKTVGSSQDVEFTVQVASYPTAEAAKEHASELVKKGFPAFPVEATVGGKTWYRVSVGSFKTQKEATLYRAELLKQTTVASAIVQKIQR